MSEPANIVVEYLVETLGEDYVTVLEIADGLRYGKVQLPQILETELTELANAIEETLTVAESRKLGDEVTFRKTAIANWLYHAQGTTASDVTARNSLAMLQEHTNKSNKGNDSAPAFDPSVLASALQSMGGAASPFGATTEPNLAPLTKNEKNTENIARVLAIGLDKDFVPESIVQRIQGLLRK